MPCYTNQLLCGLLAAGALSLACSNSEAPAEDHDPVTFQINGVPAGPTDTIAFTAGTDDTLRLTFFNAADDNLDDVEAEHFSSLTFTPADSISATMLATHHFQHHVVIGAAAGQTGDLHIGFGHDALADEFDFPLHYQVQ